MHQLLVCKSSTNNVFTCIFLSVCLLVCQSVFYNNISQERMDIILFQFCFIGMVPHTTGRTDLVLVKILFKMVE